MSYATFPFSTLRDAFAYTLGFTSKNNKQLLFFTKFWWRIAGSNR